MDLAIIERLYCGYIKIQLLALTFNLPSSPPEPRVLLLLIRVKGSATRTVSTQLVALELSRIKLFKNGNLHQSNQITISLT
jgi:hypothetical protein